MAAAFDPSQLVDEPAFDPSQLVDETPELPPGAVRRTYDVGRATVFGLNLDGSPDRQDNGIGAWGTPTNNTDIVGVSLPVKVVRDRFGKGDAAHGRLVEVVNPRTGATILAPIVDKGPAAWTGNALDLTHRAAHLLGSTGRDEMAYRILDDEEHTRASQTLSRMFEQGHSLTAASVRALTPDATYTQIAGEPPAFDPSELVDEFNPEEFVTEHEYAQMQSHQGLDRAGRLDIGKGAEPTMMEIAAEPLPTLEAPDIRLSPGASIVEQAAVVAPLADLQRQREAASRSQLAPGYSALGVELDKQDAAERQRLRDIGVSDEEISRRLADLSGLTPKVAARLSDGTVTVNPELAFSPDQWEAAARSVGGSEEEVQRAIKERMNLREFLAPEVDAAASRSIYRQGSRGANYFPGAYTAWLDKRAQAQGMTDRSQLYDRFTEGDLLEEFYKETGTGLGNVLSQSGHAMSGAVSSVGQGVYGFADMVTPDFITGKGLQNMADQSREMGDETSRIRHAMGGGWWAQRVANVAGAAVSTMPAFLGAPAGLSGMALAGGAIQAGQTQNDALAAGYSPGQALAMGVGSGAVEAGLTAAFGASGVEAITAAKGTQGIGRRFLTGSASELPEELLQQAGQIPFQQATDPNYKPTAEEFLDVGLASALMGGSMHVMHGEHAPRPQQAPASAQQSGPVLTSAPSNSVDLTEFSNPVTNAGQSIAPGGMQTTANATPPPEPTAVSGAAPAPVALSADELAAKHGIAPEIVPSVRQSDWETLERRAVGTSAHASALEFVTRTATARAKAAAKQATAPEAQTQAAAPTEQAAVSTGETGGVAAENASVQPTPVAPPEQSASQLSAEARDATLASINAQLGKLSPADQAAHSAAQAEYEAELQAQLADHEQSTGRPLDVAVRLLGGLPSPESAKAGAHSGELAALAEGLLEARRDQVRGEKTKAKVLSEVFNDAETSPDDLINGLREQGFDVHTLADVTELLADGYGRGKHWIGTGTALDAQGAGTDMPFSQQTAAPRATPGRVTATQALAEKLAKRIGLGKVRVQVVQGLGQMPSVIARQHGLVTRNLIEAYLAPDGSVVLNLDHVSREAAKRGQSVESRVRQLIIHEAVGHGGMSALFASRLADWHAATERLFAKLGNSVFSEADTKRLGYSTLKELAALYGFDLTTVQGRAAAIEEHVARLAEAGIKPSWWTAFVARIKDALKRLGFGDGRTTDDEIAALLGRAKKAVQTKADGRGETRYAQQQDKNQLDLFQKEATIGNGESADIQRKGSKDSGAKAQTKESDILGRLDTATREEIQDALTEGKGRISSIIAKNAGRDIPNWNINGAKIERPEDFALAVQAIRSPHFESLKVAFLNDDDTVAHSQLLTVGSVDQAIASPREIILAVAAAGKAKNASGRKRVIVSHNHPSGDPSPSDADRRVQKMFEKAAQMLRFDIIDHVITNGESYHSMRNDVTMEITYPKLSTWENNHRSKLTNISGPESMARVVNLLRTPGASTTHAIYTNTRSNITAIERFDGNMSPNQLASEIAAGMAREGANGVFLDGGDSLPAYRLRDISENLRGMGFKMIDATTKDVASARMDGLIMESGNDIRFAQQPAERAIERALLADPKDLKPHGLTDRMANMPGAPDAVQTMAQGLYATYSDNAAIADATRWLGERTEEQAIRELLGLKDGQGDKLTFTAAQLMVERLHARGEHTTAGLIAQNLAAIATTFGQAIQSLHMMLNLADEAAVITFAQKEFADAAKAKIKTQEGADAAADLTDIKGKLEAAAKVNATTTVEAVAPEIEAEVKAEMTGLKGRFQKLLDAVKSGLAKLSKAFRANVPRMSQQSDDMQGLLNRIDELDLELRTLQQTSKHELGKTQTELQDVRKSLALARKALQTEQGRGTAGHIAQALAILNTAHGLTAERQTELLGKLRGALMTDDGSTGTADRIKGILVAAGMQSVRAGALAKRVTEGYRGRQKMVREKLIRQLAQGAAPRVTSKLPKGEVDRWLKMNAEGMLDDGTLFAGIAKRWGFPIFTSADAGRAKDFVRRYNSTNSAEVKLAIGAEMMDWMHSHTSPATFMDKASALYRLTKLMSFKTLFRIVGGNAAAALLQTVAIDLPRYGLSTLGVVVGMKYQPLQTAIGATVDGVREAARIFHEGKIHAESEGKSGVRGGLNVLLHAAKEHTSAIRDAGDLKRQAGSIFSSRAMKGFENFMHFMLTVPDYPRFAGEVRQSLARSMRRDGNQVPTAEQYEKAYLDAQRSVWLNRERAAKVASTMTKALNLVSTAGMSAKFGLGTVVMPFTTVPANLVVEGAKWTPLGFVQALYEGVRDFGQGDQRSATNTLLKAAVGTAGLGQLGAYLFALGILTAGDDDDRDVQKLRELAGWQRYSVNASELKRRMLAGDWTSPARDWQDGDMVESFAFLQPAAFALSAGAERERLARKYRSDAAAGKPVAAEGWWTSLAQPLGGAAKAFTDQPLTMGLSVVGDDIKRMVDDGDPAQMLALYSRALDFVPSIVRDIRYGANDALSETRHSNAVIAELQRVVGGVAPSALPQRFDLLGRAQHKYDAARSGWLNALFNPLTERIVRKDPIVSEALRLWSATNEKGVIPDQTKAKVTINPSPDPRTKRTLLLTTEQIAEHQRLTGQLTASAMTFLMSHPAYTRWPDAIRAKEIGKQIAAASGAAKMALFNDCPLEVGPTGARFDAAAAAAYARGVAAGIIKK